MGKTDLEATHFLNVDLDIHSNLNLEPLVAALGKQVFPLHVGRIKRTYCAHLELARDKKDADRTVRAFCTLIASLPKHKRQLWNSAKVRDFNIGIQAGVRPHSQCFVLGADTVKAASEVGARIVVTVYAPEKDPRRSPATRIG